METSVLEFKLHGALFCLNSEHVEYVFELEEYTPLEVLDEVALGIAKYNDDVMVLIDTSKLYGEAPLTLDSPKSVIVVSDETQRRFGLLVDEIVKIEDVEVAQTSAPLSASETTIRHYKAKDVIINEIDPFALLKKRTVPGLVADFKKSHRIATQSGEGEKEYLLFRIAQKTFAIETTYVREVLEYDAKKFTIDANDTKFNGAMAVRDEVIKLAAIESTQEASDVIVVEYKHERFGIEADAIVGIESFESARIEPLPTRRSYVKGFYNFQNGVVAIVDVFYFLRASATDKNVETRTQKGGSKIPFLVFEAAQKRFCIAMEHIRYVTETQTLSKTHSSAIAATQYVEFITTWNHHAVSVLSLREIVGASKNDDSQTQTIFVELDGKYVAFIVDEIEDIVNVEERSIAKSDTSAKHFIEGVVLHNDRPIAILNFQKFLGAKVDD